MMIGEHEPSGGEQKPASPRLDCNCLCTCWCRAVVAHRENPALQRQRIAQNAAMSSWVHMSYRGSLKLLTATSPRSLETTVESQDKKKRRDAVTIVTEWTRAIRRSAVG